ncbi:ParB/RepB/Spo0J family partition protein [Rhodoferax lacus]|nr:ParB/RepB/Spo0J family partition protein [Rhodoferax lacus]
MALKDKPKVDLSHIGLATVNRASGAKTAIGMHADALFRDEQVTAENIELKQKLAAFGDANPSRKLDPKLIKPSKWANRNELSYDGVEFAELKLEIESAGGNIQAIKVRPSKTVAGEYELVFGHRRHRACLELDIPVLAVIEDLVDSELFCQMDRENRARAALSPWEAGTTYAKALDEGLFPSARKLSEAASIDLSQLGKALALARLPADVINAFSNPLELQYRWAPLLTQAIQKDPDLILSRAKELLAAPVKLKAPQVLTRLLEGGGTVPPPAAKKVVVKGKDGQSAEIKLDPSKRSAVISLANIDPKRFSEVEKAIKALLS